MILVSLKIGTSEEYGKIAFIGAQNGSTSFLVQFSGKHLHTQKYLLEILHGVSGQESVEFHGQNMGLERTPSMFMLTVATDSLPKRRSTGSALQHVANEIETQLVGRAKLAEQTSTCDLARTIGNHFQP